MDIRGERAGDAAAIGEVTAAAFAGAAHSDGSEAAIVARLRREGALALSLVAVERGAIIGHIAFSPVTVAGAAGRWFGLGPLSVAPARQGAGVGSALVRAGLARLTAAGAASCVVLGDPGYYARFGFAVREGLVYPGAPAAYFMALALNGAAAPVGEVAYAPAFGA